jgi:hypothetical protein
MRVARANACAARQPCDRLAAMDAQLTFFIPRRSSFAMGNRPMTSI